LVVLLRTRFIVLFYFFFQYTAPTLIYTLSLHDSLPIWDGGRRTVVRCECRPARNQHRPVAPARRSARALVHRQRRRLPADARAEDRKSTRLNSSHRTISYAVFCLKKKIKSKLVSDAYIF